MYRNIFSSIVKKCMFIKKIYNLSFTAVISRGFSAISLQCSGLVLVKILSRTRMAKEHEKKSPTSDPPELSRFWTDAMTCSLTINFLLDAIHALLRYCVCEVNDLHSSQSYPSF